MVYSLLRVKIWAYALMELIAMNVIVQIQALKVQNYK